MKKLYAFLDNLAQTYMQESLVENTTENKRHFLRQLSQILEPFYREKGNVFYDKNDIDAFCNFMHELHEDAEYMTNWREQLGDILQNALSWREKPAQDTQALYFFWDMLKELENEKGISSLKDNTLSELTERLLQENSPAHILVMPPHTENPYQAKDFIATFKDTFETQNLTLPAFAKIQYTTDKQQVLDWIKKHRQPWLRWKRRTQIK
jgi:quinol monooxygenase YgiN